MALAATAGLTACGQKGPLFFPPPPKPFPTAGVTAVTPVNPASAPVVETPDIPQPPPAAPFTSAPR